MKLVRVVDPDRTQALHVVMLGLLVATLAGSCLLTSGPHARMEGSRDWHEESPLRAVVNVLNLNYTQTTALGIEIKALVFGIGAAVAVAACGLAFLLQTPAGEDTSPDDETIAPTQQDPPQPGIARRQLGPLAAAQLLMAAYVGWSFLSANPKWSTAPDLALGGSVLLAVGVVWALALGRGLNRPTANAGAGLLLGICTVTAIIAIAYYGERNPTRRASYPIGNPLFLAACLMPGVLLSIGFIIASIRTAVRRPASATAVVTLLCLAAAAAMLWTIYLTSARAAAISLALGCAAMLFFAVPHRLKWRVALGIAVTMAAGLAYAWPRFTAPSATGRDATLRLRQYAWWYAIDMIEEAPIIGHGQGAFTQFGDTLASQDVLDDPQALEARIAHAHNEWLEVGADLGAVGVTLVLAALALTFWAGMSALTRLSDPRWRWTLVALLASLAAMVIEESSDVALRIAGFPAVFYTVLGLVWALSRTPAVAVHSGWQRRPMTRMAVGGIAVAVGAALLWASLADFQSARAAYGTNEALQSRDFDRAVTLARRAVAHRLSPQRRLEALERLCSTHLYIARERQTTSLNRYARAQQDDAPNEHLRRLADADRAEAERHCAEAKNALEALVRRSPTYSGAGWLEYRMNQLLNVYARVDGDDTLASRAETAAALALERELKRSPYDPLIAISLIEVARHRMSLDQVLDILARPLRRAPMPADYPEFMAQLTADEGFNAEFIPIWERIIRPDVDVLQDDPLAPEKLRLAALVRFIRQDYARALDTVRLANTLYERLPADAAIAAASALMEAAEYQLYADPTQWRESVALAERGRALLPPSTPGRELAAELRRRMILYYLAGGDETSARELASADTPLQDDEHAASELGRYYTALCKSFIHSSRGSLPQGFPNWVARAIALRPQDELAWRLNAQVAFDERRFNDSVTHLRRALDLGADPTVVYTFVQLALREHPENKAFRTLMAELQNLLSTESGSPPASPESPPATDR